MTIVWLANRRVKKEQEKKFADFLRDLARVSAKHGLGLEKGMIRVEANGNFYAHHLSVAPNKASVEVLREEGSYPADEAAHKMIEVSIED